jgi:arylformamidase
VPPARRALLRARRRRLLLIPRLLTPPPLNPWLGLDAGEAVALSPQLDLPAALPPTVLAHGTAETAEFARQTRDYGAALAARGFDVEVMALPRNHFDILDDLADADGPLARAVARLAHVL